MNNNWSNPRIWKVVEVLLESERSSARVEPQPRAFNLSTEEYALAVYLHKALKRVAHLVREELDRSY